MKQEDGLDILRLLSGADGGCPHCIQALLRDARRMWPELDWAAIAKEGETLGGHETKGAAKILQLLLEGKEWS